MDERVELLPDPELDPLRSYLEERLAGILANAGPGQFRQLFVNQLVRSHLGAAFHAAGASEGTFWLTDSRSEELVPVFNNGARAKDFLDEIRQPMGSGLIGMVLSTQQSFCENEVYRNALHDRRIDEALEVVTCAMIATPVHIG